MFSKSFGYSLRGILYIAKLSNSKSMVSIDEIAEQLAVPRHFLSKVMNRLVKEGIINSKKGPAGGFCLNDITLQTPLTRLMEITGETQQFSLCVMSFRNCNAGNPCPLHDKADEIKRRWHHLLSATIGDILKNEHGPVTGIVRDNNN